VADTHNNERVRCPRRQDVVTLEVRLMTEEKRQRRNYDKGVGLN